MKRENKLQSKADKGHELMSKKPPLRSPKKLARLSAGLRASINRGSKRN